MSHNYNMVENKNTKELRWLGNSKKNILKFPDMVRRTFGTALFFAQKGGRYPDTKMMKGLGSGVYEILEDHKSDTYRAVYTVKFEKCAYVLHAFQKKSKSGIKTPKEDVDLIKSRMKMAKELENE